MSSTLPTGVRALLGLAAMAVEEVRKIPETLPTVAATVPVGAISTAMQASLKFQQQVAVLAARGDEVISQFRGSHEDPPAWATFDDDEPADAETRPLAAFDRIDYDATAEDSTPGVLEEAAETAAAAIAASAEALVKKAGAKKAPAKKAAAKAAKKAPVEPVPGNKAPAKKAAQRKQAGPLSGEVGPAATNPVVAAGPATPQPSAGPAVPDTGSGPMLAEADEA